MNRGDATHHHQTTHGVVLHRRPYTDTKLLLTLFTHDFGKLNCVVRRSRKIQAPQPFTDYEFFLNGKSTLKNLSSAELIRDVRLPPGRPTFCAMYLNELLDRMMPEMQAHERVLEFYIESISKLVDASTNELQEVLLRRFELFLLQDIGLGISFRRCRDQSEINPAEISWYRFSAEEGFVFVSSISNASSSRQDTNRLFSSKTIGEIADQSWTSESLRAAKSITRIAMASQLGSKPLKSRELFG